MKKEKKPIKMFLGAREKLEADLAKLGEKYGYPTWLFVFGEAVDENNAEFAGCFMQPNEGLIEYLEDSVIEHLKDRVKED